MSSTQRKALGVLDPNRLRQQQSAVQHRNRRRPKSKSRGSSEQSSLASYADDSGFDFLSNPDPTSKFSYQTSKEVTNSEKSSEVWNSTSKTPKLSNVTTTVHEQAVPRSDDNSIPVSSAWNQSTATSTNVATIDSTSNSGKGSIRNKVKEAKKPAKREGITAEISSAFEKWKKFRQRSKNNPENEYLSISSSLNNGHSFLETITEGTVEQENSSPIEAKNADDPISYALSESQVAEIDNDMSIKNRGTEVFRLDDTKHLQFKETSAIHDYNACAENGENSDMDIDESSGDESTDLTICPIDASQTENIPDMKEIPYLGKNQVREGEIKSSTDGKPTNTVIDIQNMSEECNNTSVSQHIALQAEAEDSATLGIPHHTRKCQDNPSKRVKYLQVVEPLSPRTAPIVNLDERVIKKVRSPDACLLPIVDNKTSTFIEAEKGCSMGQQHPVPQNDINNALFATTNLTAIAQNEAKKTIKAESENKYSTKKENICHSPIDKEVWQAVLGTRDAKPESELIGLIIETPARTSSLALEIESTVGSELTNASSLSIGEVRGSDANAQRGGNKSFQSENHKKPSTQVETPKPNSVIKSTSYRQDTLVKSSSVHSASEIIPSQRQHIHVKPKISSGKVVSSYTSTSGNEDDGSKRDEFAADNRVKTRLQTPDRGTVSLLLIQTPTSVVKVQSHEPSNRQDLEILNQRLQASGKDGNGPPTVKPFSWTAETAGRKFKEFGVNAAPVFRLTDGAYYQHPPLPPGWTIAVSRSLNVPYYIHPDWGTTFYSPVPLPSIDDTIVGTTLLYQADTPQYCPPEDYTSRPHANTTPNVLTAPGLPSIRWSDDTSTVLSKNFEKARINTPLGALVVASTTLFSESQNGMISNSALKQQMIGLTPLSMSKENGDLESVAFHFESSCNSSNSSGSTDSSTTVTLISNERRDSQTTIPREIEIKRNLDDDMNIDRFKIDLKNASENVNSASCIPISANSRNPKPIASRDVELVISPQAETDENRASEKGIEDCSKENSPQKGTVTSEKQPLLSDAMGDSDDSSLDWTAAISEGSCNSKTSNCKISQPPNQGSPDQVACEVGSNSGDFRQESMVILDDDHSPFDSSPPADHTDTVPRKIEFALSLQGDDMSMLQCSPHAKKSKLRHSVEPSTLIVDGDEDMYIQDDDGFVSMNSTSFVSGRSSKSRASIRSLYPKLPLCSLQNLPDDFEKSKKRKENIRKKPAKRKLSGQIEPISA